MAELKPSALAPPQPRACDAMRRPRMIGLGYMPYSNTAPDDGGPGGGWADWRLYTQRINTVASSKSNGNNSIRRVPVRPGSDYRFFGGPIPSRGPTC